MGADGMAGMKSLVKLILIEVLGRPTSKLIPFARIILASD